MLLAKDYVTPEDILKLPSITNNYLCPIDANIYDIEFLRYKIRDLKTGNTILEISLSKDNEDIINDYFVENDSNDLGRFIRYQFTPNFLKLKSIGATFEFKIGNKSIRNFRMIEKHYFRNTLLQCYDFNFGFCMPNSTNTWEHIYDVPSLTSSFINDIINNPFESKSDTFYFADGKLIIHNKADYSFNGVSHED
ncbi:hypothetical protein O3M35_007786 [Rhynocoris fuscipes]|uniref:GMP phosphodiesterase delta subunit domain-containing protein n=1 Tax=Rhynocoris fuscipes TaxID=488301 RepID=A0AAW1DAI9_9HEMI